jgi:methyl-accepting chemotaxis protein
VTNTVTLAKEIEAIKSTHCVAHFDLDGTILDANEHFLQTFGYESHEIIGKNHQIFVDYETTSAVDYHEFWTKLRRGDYYSQVLRRFGKNKREVFLRAHYYTIRDQRGRPFRIAKVAVDITPDIVSRRAALSATETTLEHVNRTAVAADVASDVMGKLAGMMTTSCETMGAIQQHMHAVDGQTRQLLKSASAMDGVVKAINVIAAQINMLALNAAIESARAGEAGRGFSTVAQEVKVLASRAHDATRTAANEIIALQSQSNNVAHTINQIAVSVGDIQASVAEATAALDAQNGNVRHLATSLADVTASVHDVSQALCAS